MIKLKSNKLFVLKNKISNILMENGKKYTGEKILLKSTKFLQKSIIKNFQNLIQLAIVNSISTFKLNEREIKKGKRKVKKIVPFFIVKNSFRIITALKFLKKNVTKNQIGFHKNVTKKILALSTLKEQSVDKKNGLQIQILFKNRYMSKLR